jgi:integrase
MNAADSLTGSELLQAAYRAIPQHELSASRARQVRWVANEYSRALDHAEHPLDQDATAEYLFAAAAVDAYLTLATSGELRVRQATAPDRHSEASEQIRIQILHLLADAAGASTTGLPSIGKATARPPVAAPARSLLRESLTALADRPGASPGQRRMLAIGAMVADTAARAGEMCQIDLDDLSPTLEEVRLQRRPQGQPEEAAYVELVELSPLTRAALRRWLPVRQELMQHVQGTPTRSLWVSLHANHHDGRTVPAGTSLQPRGLARAWTRAVVDVNAQLGGEPGWEPLPTRMEQLRRGVEPTAVRAPAEPDAERAPELLDAVADRAADLAAAREAEEGSTAELEARVAVRAAMRTAWAEGLPHQAQLAELADVGLDDAGDRTAAGWDPALLAVL